MQPIVNASQLLQGMILFHQPRGHYYKLIYRTMIKSGERGWEYGWAYQQVTKENDVTFVGDVDAEIYSRPDSMFDSDWSIPV